MNRGLARIQEPRNGIQFVVHPETREELKHIDFDCIDDIRSRLFGQEENHPLNDVDSDVEKQTLVDFSFRVGIQIFTRTRTRD